MKIIQKVSLSLCFLLLGLSTVFMEAQAQEVTFDEFSPEVVQEENTIPQNFEEKTDTYVEALVTKVQETEEIIPLEDGDYNGALEGVQKRITQEVEVKVMKGPFAKRTFSTKNILANRAKDLHVKVGERVILDIVQGKLSKKITETNIIDFYRTDVVWYIILLFCLAVILFGGKKGFAAIVGLVTTFLIIFLVLIPYIMKGGNPMWLAIVTSIVVTFLVHLFVGGLSPKSLSSTAGTAGGMLVAGIFASVASGLLHLKGLSTDDALNLFLKNPNLDFHGIFLAGIVIGSLGAVMDIGISISSAITEVKSHAPNATFKQLFDAGMNIGKDTLGTMTNTLVLAYAGSAMPLIIIMMLSSENWGIVLGYDFIADEILRSAAGSFGLLVTIPITAFVSAKLESRK